MKIGILTQPLGSNYGGILQNYALQRYLFKMGHEAITISYPGSKLKRNIHLRFLIGKLLRNKKIVKNLQLIKFINRHIKTTEFKKVPLKYSDILNYGFDAIIVGSDQTWRKKYSPCIDTFFLDFLDDNSKIIRLAYASSWGTEQCEFSEEELARLKPLAHKFKAISVREDSGVTLCREYLGVDATHLIDPTMLLTKEDYRQLIDNDDKLVSDNKYLFSYVLDMDSFKSDIIEQVSKSSGLEKCLDCYQNLSANGYNPSIYKWLRGIADSDFVVTDSFHGTVFSIIFNKPFIAISNENRGATRFSSLLKIFGLDNRLVYGYDRAQIIKIVGENIDWDSVNYKILYERQKTHKFLLSNLRIKETHWQ